MEKRFLAYDRQLEHLELRGVAIGDSSAVVDILSRKSYYNIVNGYRRLFLDQSSIGDNRPYKSGTTLHELESLLVFDSDLRIVCLKRIPPVDSRSSRSSGKSPRCSENHINCRSRSGNGASRTLGRPTYHVGGNPVLSRRVDPRLRGGDKQGHGFCVSASLPQYSVIPLNISFQCPQVFLLNARGVLRGAFATPRT
jgi:hypothetical protein